MSLTFQEYEAIHDKIISMNKQQFDHYIMSFDDAVLLLNVIINFIRIKETYTGKEKVGVKKKKKIIDYINSSSIAVMIKKIIELKHQTTVCTIMSIVSKVDKIKNCLLYSLFDYAVSLDNVSDSAIIVENTIGLFQSKKLWIEDDKIDMITSCVNRYHTYFINQKNVVHTLAQYPNIVHSDIEMFALYPTINPTFYYQKNLEILNQMITQYQNKKYKNYFKSVSSVLHSGTNYIVDGRNMFFDTAVLDKTDSSDSSSDESGGGDVETKPYLWEKSNMINLKKVESFIQRFKEQHLVIVFYNNHMSVLNGIVEKYRADSSFNVDFVFTKNGIDDDKTSLFLWMSNSNNLLFTNDQFNDHVKKFHDDKFWYPFWKYHYTHFVAKH